MYSFNFLRPQFDLVLEFNQQIFNKTLGNIKPIEARPNSNPQRISLSSGYRLHTALILGGDAATQHEADMSSVFPLFGLCKEKRDKHCS